MQLTAPMTSPWLMGGPWRRCRGDRPRRPTIPATRDAARVRPVHAVAGQRGRELLERRARVGDQRQRGVLVGVELGDVDVDEAHVRVLERGLGGGGEVAVARADADHQVGLARGQVRARRAGHADGAQVLRMVEGQRALAGLVSATGMPVAAAKRASASVASL